MDNNPALVPLHSYDKRPEYLIYAGIVFTVLTRFYLYSWGKRLWREDAPKHLVSLADSGKLQKLDQQIVLINQILADDINYGISSNVENTVLKAVNGIEINNIKHLAQLIDEISSNGDDAYIRFATDCKKFIVIECEQARQSEARILAQNSITHARSESLRQSPLKSDEDEGEKKSS